MRSLDCFFDVGEDGDTVYRYENVFVGRKCTYSDGVNYFKAVDLTDTCVGTGGNQ